MATPASIPAAELFELVRTTLVDAIGTASVAVLIRRAVDRASRAGPRQVGLVVAREGMGYRYHLPDAWRERGDQAARDDLAAIVGALLPLVAELSGASVVRRVVGIAPLREQGITSAEDMARWKAG